MVRMRSPLGRIPQIQSLKHNIAPALWNRWFRGAGVL